MYFLNIPLYFLWTFNVFGVRVRCPEFSLSQKMDFWVGTLERQFNIVSSWFVSQGNLPIHMQTYTVEI